MLQLIVNPIAGSGASIKAAEAVCAQLDARRIDYRLTNTAHPGHATDLAHLAVSQGVEGIVAIGGDGTLSEIVNGIGESGVTMYFVPCGTGNDLARSLPFSKDPAEAFVQQLDGVPARMDIGQINDTYFLNISGAGFDVEVLRQVDNYKHLGHGLKPYLLGLIAALKNFRPFSCQLLLDGQEFARRLTILSVANGRYFGGGMCPAPGADLADGEFEVVLIDKLPRFAVPFLLPFFILGKHTHLPPVKVCKCREVLVRSEGMTVNIDGELKNMNEARYRILPGALRIRRPAY